MKDNDITDPKSKGYDPKKLTEDTESKSEVVQEVVEEVKMETEEEAIEPELRAKDNEVNYNKVTKTEANEDKDKSDSNK